MGTDWLSKENERITKEREVWMEEKGIKELLQLEKGENQITIDLNQEPRTAKTKYGERFVFSLTSPAGKNFMCSSVLYGQIVQYIAKKKTGKLTLLRSGVGTDTKIELMEK